MADPNGKGSNSALLSKAMEYGTTPAKMQPVKVASLTTETFIYDDYLRNIQTLNNIEKHK